MPSLNTSGILDAKSYINGYSLNATDVYKMTGYVENHPLIEKDLPLGFVGYVCPKIGGTDSFNVKNLNSFKDKTGIPAFMIEVEELISFKNKHN